MKMTDIKTLVTDATKQLLGQAELDALDSFELSDMGKVVTANNNTINEWSHGIVTRLGVSVFMNEDFSKRAKGLFVSESAWGGYIQRIYAEPLEFYDDLSWNLVDKQQYPAHTYYSASTSAKLFDELKSLEVRISVERDRLYGAFESWDEMNAFITGIYKSVENTIDLGMRSIENMLIGNGIAISDANTETAIHLLTEYNTKYSKSLDAESAIADDGFLRYCVQRIKNIRIRAKEPSIKYNDGTHVTSIEGHEKFFTLADFTTNLDIMLLGTVYGAQYYNIGEHMDVPYWQAVEGDTDDTDFKINSTVNISADSNNKLGIGTTEYNKPYCIGFLCDDRALGYSFIREKVTEEYTASGDFWTYYHKMSRNCLTDIKFDMIAFFVD